MDFIERGLSPSNGIRVFYVDVTETSATLERRHLSGPTAARILGEAIAAVALLSADLKSEDEVVSLQLRTKGPIGGIMAEANGRGMLRGYTHQKILNRFDGEDTVEDPTEVMGTAGMLAVVRSSPRRVLGVGQVEARPPTLANGLRRYFTDSQQSPAAAEFHATSREGRLHRAVGLLADRMPGGNDEVFRGVRERFESGAVRRFLDSSTRILDFQELFSLEDLDSLDRRELRFGCHCNYEKIAEVVSTLPDEEIRRILDSGRRQRVTCHFCGETYRVREDTLRQILDTGGGAPGGGSEPAAGTDGDD